MPSFGVQFESKNRLDVRGTWKNVVNNFPLDF